MRAYECTVQSSLVKKIQKISDSLFFTIIPFPVNGTHYFQIRISISHFNQLFIRSTNILSNL